MIFNVNIDIDEKEKSLKRNQIKILKIERLLKSTDRCVSKFCELWCNFGIDVALVINYGMDLRG